MPHDKGLPQTGDSQEIGEEAYDCLRAKRPKNWHITPLDGGNDFGFDLQIQLSVNQQVSYPFRAQLKGTRSPKRSADGSYLAIALSTTTLRFFDNTNEPVLLVLCDLSVAPDDPRECNLYYVWIRDELDRIEIASISLDQKEATIRVPTANVLDRSTDLVEEVRKRHRLSMVGHDLETSVADMAPSLGAEERVVMVEAMTKGIGNRSIVFAQALADPITDMWVSPPAGSLAWFISEGKAALAAGLIDKCEGLLQQAAARLEGSTALEQAEYSYLDGRARLVRRDDDGATRAFKAAAATHPLPKYWAAWAESELRRRFKARPDQDYSDILEALPLSADPTMLGIKARLLAASGRNDEAFALLDTFTGPENLSTKAVLHTLTLRPEDALQACIDGLALEEKRDQTKLLFLILRARARFNIALKNAQVSPQRASESKDDILPPSGPIGVDASALRVAWNDIEEAVEAVEEIRWISNAEFVVDVWIATAAMLGKQEQILPRVLAAARQRPQLGELQTAAETIAAQCGDFEAALEANSRSPDSDMKTLRRVAFLHDLGRHRDCVELMSSQVNSVDRQHALFCPALVLATVSAEVMARADLVEVWRGILEGGDREWQGHAATLAYLLARRRSQLQGNEPLGELDRLDTQLGHPKATTLLLFQELDPGSPEQAERFLSVATRLRAHVRLSPVVAARIGVALFTLKRWADLLALCEEAEAEFEATGRIRAFHACALDQLGRSAEANAILESMIEDGSDDGLALNTYVNITVRWGYTDKAKSAVERILERARTKERRFECIRMLFNLEQHADPASPRLVDLAFRIGELTNREDEVEEGTFISMAIAATSFGGIDLSEARVAELQSRAGAFFGRFPQSKVVRQVEFPRDAKPDELLRAMKSAIGLSEEQEERQAQLEARLQSGELPVPFAWRPRLALGNVQDVAHLWELAKKSSREDKKFHLTIVADRWDERRAEVLRSKTPLIDLMTLFVLMDLDLLDKLFEFFPTVAISQGTLSELVKMSQAFSGSIYNGRCIELQERLRSRLPQILQPHASPREDNKHVPRSTRELQSLADTGDYFFYCDDAMLRMWVLRERFAADGLCTLDLLCGLEEVGLLTTQQAAVKLAQLCDWNVGIQIQLRHQLALIPSEVHTAADIAAGAGVLRGSSMFMSLANGMWGPHSDFIKGFNHIRAVVRLLLLNPAVSSVTIGAFAAIWLDQALTRHDVPALLLTGQVVLGVVAGETLPVHAARRLWDVYLGLLEQAHGSLDKTLIDAAIRRVAREAGTLDKKMEKQTGLPTSRLGERLMMGLDPSSNAWVTFSGEYVAARR